MESTKSAPQMMEGNKQWHQQLKYWLQLWMKRQIHSQCEFNTKSLQNIWMCSKNNLCKKPLRQLNFLLQGVVFNDAKLVFKCQFLQKNHPYVNATNQNVKSAIFLSFRHFLIMPFLLPFCCSSFLILLSLCCFFFLIKN